MPTPLYPLMSERVAEEQRALTELNTAWRFLKVSGLSITDYYGKPIRYSGIRFEGSPQHVFWSGFWEPYIHGAAKRVLEWTIETCRTRHLRPDDYLFDAHALLRRLVQQTYNAAAETDQVLRGRGYPKSVRRVDVSGRIKAMNDHIDSLGHALTHAGEAPPPPETKHELFEMKPGIGGFSINLKAVWPRIQQGWRWLRKR